MPYKFIQSIVDVSFNVLLVQDMSIEDIPIDFFMEELIVFSYCRNMYGTFHFFILKSYMPSIIVVVLTPISFSEFCELARRFQIEKGRQKILFLLLLRSRYNVNGSLGCSDFWLLKIICGKILVHVIRLRRFTDYSFLRNNML